MPWMSSSLSFNCGDPTAGGWQQICKLLAAVRGCQGSRVVAVFAISLDEQQTRNIIFTFSIQIAARMDGLWIVGPVNPLLLS